MGLDEIDVVLKLSTLNELDDVSNLNQSIWVWLIAQGFSGIGSNQMCCDFVGSFLQSAICICYLGCGSNRLYLQNSLEGEVALIYILASSWIYWLMSWYFTSGRFTRVSPVFTDHMFQHPVSYQVWLMFLFCHLVC